MKLLDEFSLTESQISMLQKYEELLLEWNEKFNLTAITKADEIEEKHFVDSLEILKFFDLQNKTLLDVGTGAGFPGIVLAIAVSNLKVTLLESNGKKVTFLKAVIDALKLQNVDVILGRAEEQQKRENFDVVTARAVKELNTLLEISFHMLKVGGTFIAMKGSNADQELENAKRALKVLDGKVINKFVYNLPASKDPRVIIEIQKVNKTQKKYPRRYAEIVKSPL